MRNLTNWLLLPALIFASSLVMGQTSQIVSGSTKFSVKFIMGTCKGTFAAPAGSAVFNEKSPENASFDIKIAANTFKTGNNSRDKDMKSEKYFYVEKYPDIHFKSAKVEKKDGRYQVTGKLTMRDVSKTVTLPFDAKKNSDGSYMLTSTFEINRLDYKIGEKDWKLKDIVTVDLQATAR
ncbi:YceI family protein [Dyadobacter aurulentus]|uniref:YceI family protein n=1 Tax=Dyadobacter sp. UC 10 TaxID=2605428 RepID=UPI0011F1CDAB|nr:YceI family protein [Dyadobacter sp. UC 10]KAA0989787.1 YceI family protein [Dyadobacter sp. UC 10]